MGDLMTFKQQYNKLIRLAIGKNRIKDTLKYEYHHIIPKSLGGGDSCNNKVYLTFQEHYKSHYFLTKMYPDNNDLAFAFWGMNNQRGGNSNRDYRIDAKLYSESRAKIVQLMKGVRYSLGCKRNIETRKLMSKQTTGKYSIYFKGYFITPWGKFDSVRVASENNKSATISYKTIYNWCKNSKSIILTEKRYYQNKDFFNFNDVGKSIHELGFSFEAADRVVPEKIKKKKKVLKGKDHPRYGYRYSKKEIEQMRLASTGVNSSWFKGYYCTPFGKFPSSHGAEKETGYRINGWCKNNLKTIKKIHVTKYPELFTTTDVNKTFKEIGFYFESMVRNYENPT